MANYFFSSTETASLDAAAALGRNGAAFAALGEIPVDFFPLTFTFAVTFTFSLVDKNEGVKLGESTLNDFFMLSSLAAAAETGWISSYLSFNDGDELGFFGSWAKTQPVQGQSAKF